MPNPLGKLSGILENLTGQTSKSVVGVDVGTSFIKAVQIKKKGNKAVLETYGELALGPFAGLEVGQATNLPINKIVEATQQLLKEANITSKDMVFSIPMTSTLLTVIKMPDVGRDKLDKMIPIEARKYIPTPISEVALNYWIVPHLEGEYVDPDQEEEEARTGVKKTDVLIAAIHNEVIRKYRKIAEKIGVEKPEFEVEVFSTIRSTMGHDTSHVMILDMGAANTKIAMVEEGIIRTQHLINSGSQDITVALSRAKSTDMLEAEEIKRDYGLKGNPEDKTVAEIVRLAVERIFTEANRVLIAYQKESHKKVNKVVLTGGGVLLKGLEDLVKSSFETEVVFGNAFGRIEAPAILEPMLKEAGPEFAVALGLAMKKM